MAAGDELQTARSKAEELLLSQRLCEGAPYGPISVVCAPDGRALRLLSSPDRPVPAEFWAALAACEQAYDDSARQVSESNFCSSEQPRKRARPGAVHNDEREARSPQRLRTSSNIGEDLASSRPCQLAVPGWSQGSHRSESTSEVDSRSAGYDSQATAPHFLDTNFPRREDPVIPPVIFTFLPILLRFQTTNVCTRAWLGDMMRL